MTFHQNPRAVLWDLDGTLIDSADYHWQAWQAELLQHGYSLREEEFASCFGKRNDTILRMWLRPDLPDVEIARISESKEARYRVHLRAGGLALLPGVENWLQRLKRAGWRQAIATMTGIANLEAILEVVAMRQYFQAFATAEDAARGKPEPDIFLHAAQRLGVPPERCIVVEDSPAGIEAARRAGMRCIAVGAGSASGDVSVGSLADLASDVFDLLLPAAPGDHTPNQ